MFKKLTIVVITSMTLTSAALADSGPSSALQVGGKGGREAASLTLARMRTPAVTTCMGVKLSTALHPGGKDGAYAQWGDNHRACSVEFGGASIYDNYSKN